MTCCLETAILDTFRGFSETPIRPENHFVNRRECKDCLPYLVLKTSTNSGLRTSDGVQKVSVVEIAAYFSDAKFGTAKQYSDLVESWLFSSGCLELGECGCLCVQGTPISSIRNGPASTLVYTVSFRGRYYPVSSSESE